MVTNTRRDRKGMRGPAARWGARRPVGAHPSRWPEIRSLADCSAAARRGVVRTIWKWERREYGASQSRALGAIKGRLQQFDAGVLCAAERGRLLGFVDILPLRRSHYLRLRAGLVVEEQMPSRWAPSRGCPASAYWYVGSMIVSDLLRRGRPADAHACARRLQEATWEFIAAHGRWPLRVLGISATEAGRVTFLRTGFRPVATAAEAVDHRPRFERVAWRRDDLLAGCAGGARRRVNRVAVS